MVDGPSIRRRLLNWLLPSLVIVLAVGAIAVYEIAWRAATRAYDRSLLDAALALADRIKIIDGQIALDLPPAAQQVLLTDKYDRIYYLVRGPQGEIIAGHRGLPSPPERPEEQNWLYYDGIMKGEPVRVAALFANRDHRPFLIMVAETLVKRNNLVHEILIAMLIPEVLLVVGAGGLVWFGVTMGLAPLTHLRREIETRSPRALKPIDEQRAPVETRSLVRALNQLLDRLQESLTSQKRFLANAAHQLRTPVAALLAQADLAVLEKGSSETKRTLGQIHTTATRLAHLTHQLLVLARSEPGESPPVEQTLFELNRMVQESAPQWIERALAKDMDLGFELDPAKIRAAPYLVRELLENLLDNALRYTPRGGKITVRTYASGGEAWLEVEDNGPGIPEEERQRVLERFYRLEGSPGEGCGLGLAIVREIAEAHGARVQLETPPEGRGLWVRVSFPNAEA